MITRWIITRDGATVYHTSSYPRFLVQLALESALGGIIDWTTERIQGV